MQQFGHRLEFADFSWGFPQGKAQPEKGTPTANAQVKGFWIVNFGLQIVGSLDARGAKEFVQMAI